MFLITGGVSKEHYRKKLLEVLYYTRQEFLILYTIKIYYIFVKFYIAMYSFVYLSFVYMYSNVYIQSCKYFLFMAGT